MSSSSQLAPGRTGLDESGVRWMVTGVFELRHPSGIWRVAAITRDAGPVEYLWPASDAFSLESPADSAGADVFAEEAVADPFGAIGGAPRGTRVTAGTVILVDGDVGLPAATGDSLHRQDAGYRIAVRIGDDSRSYVAERRSAREVAQIFGVETQALVAATAVESETEAVATEEKSERGSWVTGLVVLGLFAAVIAALKLVSSCAG